MAGSGPKMAVAAYFPFDNRVLDGGVRASWSWAMNQWDRVATAGRAVRLVVADQAYGDFDPQTQPSAISDMKRKFAACRTAGQLIFGYVYGAGGRIPFGPPGQTYQDPGNPHQRVRCVGDQIAAWDLLYGDQIDGIYVDVGPTDCNSDGQSPVPAIYTEYVNRIHQYGYQVFLLAPLYGARLPVTEPWLRNLGFHYIGLWESGWKPYMGDGYKAINYCDPDWNVNYPPDNPLSPIPEWWHEDQSLRYSRVHIINNCPDEQKMREVADRAIEQGAWTIWITLARQDPVLGSVYDQLPPYWDAEVRYFMDQDRRQFVPVFAEGAPGNGIGGYDLAEPADRAFAFDYNSTGKLDHLTLYRPGFGTIYILRNSGGSFGPVFAEGSPGHGIGGYDLADPADRAFAFDYNSTGKLDHLTLYRPGQGTIWILKQQ
jgi:hypothetical protein